MHLLRRALTGVLLLGAAAPLAAQSAGAIELGGFARFNHTDSHLNFDDRVGVGGRLGIFVLRNLAVEADGSYNPIYTAEGDFVRYIPWHARLVYNLPVGKYYSFLIGAGYTDNWFRKAYRETEHGAGGLLGFRLGTGDVLSIRVDGTLDYIFDPESRFSQDPPIGVQGIPSIERIDKNWHWGVQAGLSLLFGAKSDRDSDKDGVLDKLDQCPNTPAGDRVDAKGCSLDSDGDGVKDGLDQCPSSPPGDKVDANGCSVDTDKDGVRDAIDQCPDTPAGEKVDANGCSLPKDSDNDGVNDSQDRCPNTRPGAKVDAVGCELLFEQTERGLVLEGTTFATGKSILRPEAKETLDRVVEALNGNPSVRIEIHGYTDSTGSKALNARLSKARADAVKAYLVHEGITADRLDTFGHGPEDPIADNKTAAGRAQNRRVELRKAP